MLLETLWGEAPNNHYIVIPGLPKGKQTVRVRDAAHAQALAEALSERGLDVYFSPSGFTGTRNGANTVSVPAFWVDLDVGDRKGYANIADALRALLGYVSEHSLPNPTHVVQSGRGMHIYWVLDAPVPPEKWKPVAQQFKQALRLGGVKADPQRTADPVSLLRVPGTRHYKDPDNPLDVTVLKDTGRRVTFDEFAAALPAVGPQRSVNPKPTGEWAVESPLPPGDATAIGERCAQMQEVRDAAGRVDEPHWHAALSVLKRCEDGDRLIHEWSKGDPRYSPAETQGKADRSLGPASCAHFDECNPGGCQGCPYQGKITSPINIAMSAPEPPPEVVEQEPWKISRLGPFSVVSGGIWYSPAPTPDEPAPDASRVADFPMWVVEVQERVKLQTDQDDGSSIKLTWVALNGKVKWGVLSQADLFDAAKFRTWMANAGVAVGIRDFKLMHKYIAQLTANNLRTRGVVQYHESLGWYEDGFVVGDRKITKEGAEPSKIKSGNNLEGLKVPPKGDLEAWKKGMAALDQPGYEKQAFAVMASFGSPLLELVGWESCILSLAGQGGAGKSVAMKSALSIWGDPSNLYQGPTSSQLALEKQLAVHRQVPIGVDEVTRWKPERLGDLAYLVANGHGGNKLNNKREFRQTGNWRPTCFVTTNAAILDYSQQVLIEPQRTRILELFFTKVMPTEACDPLVHAFQHHYGLACVPYMQAIQQLKDKIPGMLEEVHRELQASGRLPPIQRHARWMIAAAKVGGAIAKSLGLINYNLDAAVEAAIQAVEENVSETQDANTVAQEAIRDWLTSSVENICFWKEGTVGHPVRDPIARKLKGNRIAVHRARLNDVLAGACVSPRAAKATFSYPVLSAEDSNPKRVRLAPGTPGVPSYIFDTRQLGFEADDLLKNPSVEGPQVPTGEGR